MTLDEACKSIGRAVVYDPGHGGRREDGTIVAVVPDHHSARVRYGHNDVSIKLTPLINLTLLGGS